MKSRSPDDSPEPRAPAPGVEPGSPLEPLLGGEAWGETWMDLVRASQSPRAPGRIGPYEILDEVRGGGQGVVFRARQPGTGRTVALKRLAAGSLATPAMRRRFERELEAVAGLAHPGIVTVHGVELIDGESLLAMEWIEGEPLTSWARRQANGREGLRARLRAFLDVCDAMQHAHQHGVIHRDLKPSNVLVNAAGRCRVLDFGLARRLPLDGQDDPTRTVGFIGTPAYAAPEHFTEGAAPLDVRSDVYSLGVVLYEVLAGRRPFAETRLRDLIDAIERREPPRPSGIVPGLGRDLDTIVAKAMAKLPERRYQSVHALADDVRRFLDGRPVLAVPQSAGYLLGTWVRRNRLAAATSLALVATVLAAAIIGSWQATVIADERDLARQRGDQAEQARDTASAALERARLEARKARVIQGFYFEAIIAASTPSRMAESTDVVTVLERAIPLLDRRFAAFPAVAIQIRAQLARAFASFGRRDEAEQLVLATSEAMAALGVEDPATEALLDHFQGSLLCDRGAYEEAVPVLERGVATYRAAEDPSEVASPLSSILVVLAQAERKLARWDAAERHATEAAELAESIGKEQAWLHARALLGEVLALTGRASDAEAVLSEALARAADTPHAENMTGAMLCRALAEAYQQLGDCAAALPLRRRAADISARFTPSGHGSQAEDLVLLGRTMVECEAHAEALECFARVASSAFEGHRYLAALALYGQADCLMALGDPALAAIRCCEAWEILCAVNEPAERMRLEVLVRRLDAHVAARQGGAAHAALSDLAMEIGRSGERGYLSGPFVARARVRAHQIDRSEDLDRALGEMLARLEAGPGRELRDYAATAEAIRAPIEALIETAKPAR